MSESCGQNCNTCSDKTTEKRDDFTANLHQMSSIKRTIGIMSGKGGVGKSLITSMLAVAMNRRGYKAAVLDADITGPSIPKAFGIKQKPATSEFGLFPAMSKTGIQIMSINLLLQDETDPVIWRGPVLSGVIKQFWSEVIWDDVDFMFIDMPPGTGDVPLTVFQSLQVDGIIIVASPQELVSMIVAKAVKMAEAMNIPILGLVENMSYFKCPDCNKEYKIFGESSIEKIAEQHHLKVLGKLPIDPKLATACDRGMIELYDGNWLDDAAEIIENYGDQAINNLSNDKEGETTMKIVVACEGDMITEHFGHCEAFMIFQTENGEIKNTETVPNPGHKPGFLPNFLHDMGIKVIISGGMGGGAIDIFNEKGVEVITGASGEAKTAVEQYLKGNLKSTGSVCHQHQHHDECSGH